MKSWNRQLAAVLLGLLLLLIVGGCGLLEEPGDNFDRLPQETKEALAREWAEQNDPDPLHEHEAEPAPAASLQTHQLGLVVLPGGCELLEDKESLRVIVKTDRGPVLRTCDAETGAVLYLWLGVDVPIVPASEP